MADEPEAVDSLLADGDVFIPDMDELTAWIEEIGWSVLAWRNIDGALEALVGVGNKLEWRQVSGIKPPPPQPVK